MKRIFSAGILFLLIGFVFAQSIPLKVGKGDVLKVWVFGQEGLTGSYSVLSDGSVTVPRIGRVLADGRTLSEIENEMKSKARAFLVDPEISVVFESERPKFVYIAGENVESGSVNFVDGMDVRQLLSSTKVPQDPGMYSATLYRRGVALLEIDLLSILSAESKTNVNLQPNDLLSILPKKSMRVWVLGAVQQAGEILVLPGSSVEKVLAVAGGVNISASTKGELTLIIRRGDELISYPYSSGGNELKETVQSGDVLMVKVPEKVSVSVGGEVLRGGSYSLKDGATVLELLSSAGGLTETGTLKSVYLFRDGTLRVLNLSQPELLSPDNMILATGDFAYVTLNQSAYHVFGEVRDAGKKVIEDGTRPRLADAISAAKGLSPNGVFRDIVVAKPTAIGDLDIKAYNLDDYFKSGKLDQNPYIQTGDIVFVRPSKGLAISEITRVITSTLYLDRILN